MATRGPVHGPPHATPCPTRINLADTTAASMEERWAPLAHSAFCS